MLTLLLTLSALAEPVVHRLSRNFTAVYAIQGEDGVVLVDAHYPDRAEWITRKLSRVGIALSDVRLLVVTHGHADHAGSAAALQAAGIPVAMGAGDIPQTAAGRHDDPNPTDWRGAVVALTVDPEYPAFTPDISLTTPLDLAEYGVAGRVEVVAGHSPGSSVVVLEDGRVMTGDLIRGGFFRRSKPTLHFFHTDVDLAHANLAELLDAGMTTALPAHGRALSADRLRRWLRRRSG